MQETVYTQEALNVLVLWPGKSQGPTNKEDKEDWYIHYGTTSCKCTVDVYSLDKTQFCVECWSGWSLTVVLFSQEL